MLVRLFKVFFGIVHNFIQTVFSNDTKDAGMAGQKLFTQALILILAV
jgi:hypothetical protein